MIEVDADELWAVRRMEDRAEIWTENGRHVGVMFVLAEAEDMVEDHNIGVEMDRPQPPDVVKTEKERVAASLASWRAQDPSGAMVTQSLVDGAQRLQRFLSLKAPGIIVREQIKTLARRVEVLSGLHPEPPEGDDA